jgi:hypothetical protein
MERLLNELGSLLSSLCFGGRGQPASEQHGDGQDEAG